DPFDNNIQETNCSNDEYIHSNQTYNNDYIKNEIYNDNYNKYTNGYNKNEIINTINITCHESNVLNINIDIGNKNNNNNKNIIIKYNTLENANIIDIFVNDKYLKQ